MFGCAAQRQIGQDTPNNGCKFEALTRARRSNHNLRICGVPINDEILVRGHRVAARLGLNDLVAESRQDAGDERAHHVKLGLIYGAIGVVRVNDTTGAIQDDLDTRVFEDRKSDPPPRGHVGEVIAEERERSGMNAAGSLGL